MSPEQIGHYLTAVVAIASILSNVVPSHTIFGKIVHAIAFNFFSLGQHQQGPGITKGS